MKVQVPKDKALSGQGDYGSHGLPADPEDKKSSGPVSDFSKKIVIEIVNEPHMDQAPEARGPAAQEAPWVKMVKYLGGRIVL